jgi:hypothetical protein
MTERKVYFKEIFKGEQTCHRFLVNSLNKAFISFTHSARNIQVSSPAYICANIVS